LIVFDLLFNLIDSLDRFFDPLLSLHVNSFLHAATEKLVALSLLFKLSTELINLKPIFSQLKLHPVDTGLMLFAQRLNTIMKFATSPFKLACCLLSSLAGKTLFGTCLTLLLAGFGQLLL
jgi:hypothetical protein